jgi:hypothetical protein
MTSKPNWACVVCGMYSSRKYSVKRHIQKVHGSGPILRYIDYITGRQAGHYLPGSFPSFEKKPEAERDLTRLGIEAFQEGYWNEAGRIAFRQGDKQPQPHRFV